jgi:hypothetical protein
MAVVVLVAAIITYLVIKMADRPKQPEVPSAPVVELPVYEAKIGDIRFVSEYAINKGNIMKKSEILNQKYNFDSQQDLVISNSGAKFIIVRVGAQNTGKINIEKDFWDIENIIDSEGREFVPIDAYEMKPWLPEEDMCGSLLKPAFEPIPCIKIYEVSKQSVGLKIRIIAKKDYTSDKKEESFLDLIVK